MIDVRFSTALQMMLSLALAKAEGVERLSSTRLAEGVASNPTFVRKLLTPLIQASLVQSVHGRDGGVRLARDAGAITLKEIYDSVRGEKQLWTQRSDIPHQCLVSCNVEGFFSDLVEEAEASVRQLLAGRTLAGALAQLRERDAAAVERR
jgi:Rrf2 family transcriptional regulator, repressor of oqxAB